MLTFTHSIDRGGVAVQFSDKPDERIRGMLKANGFRWSPAAGLWWRRRIDGTADFLNALDRAIGPRRPDGACWTCKAAEGYFRGYGAATPVYCDACEKVHRQRDRNGLADPMGVDAAYEDSCARACGL